MEFHGLIPVFLDVVDGGLAGENTHHEGEEEIESKGETRKGVEDEC